MCCFGVRRLSLLLVALLCASSAGAQWTPLGSLTSHDLGETVLTLRCGTATVRIEAVSSHVVRVRLAPEGKFGRDFSWAVRDLVPRGKFREFEEKPDEIKVSTGSLVVCVRRDPCRLEIRDADGHVLVADEWDRGMAWRRGRRPPDPADSGAKRATAVRVWQQLPDETAIYGLGEKTGPLNKRGRAWSLWNTDAPAYGGGSDPLYKSVPFFIAAREGRFHGVFFDNPWRTSFDFGQQDRDILSFGAEGGELNYYVIAGPHPKDVVQRYTALTGRMELPPLWALGYHQCRFGYYPESRVREIAGTFRRKRIPCDVLYFDIDYMDGYRCFTWDSKWFPSPKGLMDELHGMGFHTVAIIDPGIKQEAGYSVYDAGTELGAWLTKPDGETYVGRVWPGPSVFPDFTNPDVRAWWASLFPPFVESCGIDGIWNDMNEPSDFAGPAGTVPLDLRHDNEGEPARHRACHNVYGMQMVRATFDGLKQARPGQRAFAITRASYAGGQRYGAAWTGDNISTWDHLRMSITMTLNLGVSGMPFVGPDIGGFVRGASPELYARWIQVGSLFPFSRTHTAWPNPDQEPWSFGPDVEDVARRALERRYELMPYLYTLFEESTRTGLPILRPLWMEFPDLRTWYDGQVFLLGSDLYVVPIVYPDARDFSHQLPPGVWFDMNTGLIHGGGQRVKIKASLQNLPMFVRAGAIIPMQSPVQSTTHVPDEPLILDVWPFGESEGWLYEDDGKTFDYREGNYRRTRFRCRAGCDAVELTLDAPEGSYVPRERTPLVRFHGLPRAIESVTCRTLPGSGASGATTQDVPPVAHGRRTQRSDPTEPGEFCRDPGSNAWLVRLDADEGQCQVLSVKLASAIGIDPAPVRFDFTDAEQSFADRSEIVPLKSADGTVRLRVRSAWNPSVVLPRMRLSADALPILKARLATEHTTRIRVRFATEEEPTLGAESLVDFAVTADGKLHDYTVDLADASDGRWTGTVYWLRLDFAEGARAGETIELDKLCFESRSDASQRR